MTIDLPGTTSTNTKMGVSFDTCLYTSIKIHAFRARENAFYSFPEYFMILFIRLHNATRKTLPLQSNNECYYMAERITSL